MAKSSVTRLLGGLVPKRLRIGTQDTVGDEGTLLADASTLGAGHPTERPKGGDAVKVDPVEGPQLASESQVPEAEVPDSQTPEDEAAEPEDKEPILESKVKSAPAPDASEVPDASGVPEASAPTPSPAQGQKQTAFDHLPPPLAEEEKRALLKRMKIIAGGLLVVMFFIFLGAKIGEETYPWLAYVVAFSEAAIVGGLADWFAVTALFRYPMGVKFPHTAIIPNSKARIGRALGSFVEKNFLKPELVEERLSKIDMAGEVGGWLRREESSNALAQRLVNVLPHIVEALDDGETRRYIEKIAVRQLERLDFSSIAGAMLSDLPSSISHEALIDEILDIASEFLEDNKHRFRDKLSERTDWWVPSFVDNRLYDGITGALEDLIRELRDPKHERRVKMAQSLRRSMSNLRHNQDFLARFNDLRDQLVSGPTLSNYIGQSWERLKSDLRDDVAAPDSEARQRFAEILRKIGLVLETDPVVREKVNGFLRQAVLQGVLPYRSSFAYFIATVVQDWDSNDVTNRIELNVGKDLQFIRINGTLVGGLVGLTVHVVWELVAH